MLKLIGLSAIALYLNISDISPNGFQPTPLGDRAEIVGEFPWQQAKGKPYRSTYEREATGRNPRDERDLEEIRRRGYEERRQGYEHEDDYYYRSDRYRNSERSRRDRRRREILEREKREIERQIEELENRYRY